MKRSALVRAISFVSVGLCLSIYRQFKYIHDHHQQEDFGDVVVAKRSQKQPGPQHQQPIRQQRHGGANTQKAVLDSFLTESSSSSLTQERRQRRQEQLQKALKEQSMFRKRTIRNVDDLRNLANNITCEDGPLGTILPNHWKPTHYSMNRTHARVLHIGKAGGGSSGVRLSMYWNIRMNSVHPTPNKLYFENLPTIPYTLVTIRDPLDRAVSAYYWRSLILCHPHNETRPVGAATKDPMKFCKDKGNPNHPAIAKAELRVLFADYKERNFNDLAERLCNDTQAQRDLRYIQHLEHQLVGPNQWLPIGGSSTNYLSPQAFWNKFGPRIFPLVMEKPYTLEQQIDASVRWLYDQEPFETQEQFEIRQYWVQFRDATVNCTYKTPNLKNRTTTIPQSKSNQTTIKSTAAVAVDNDDLVIDELEDIIMGNKNADENQRRRLMQQRAHRNINQEAINERLGFTHSKALGNLQKKKHKQQPSSSTANLGEEVRLTPLQQNTLETTNANSHNDRIAKEHDKVVKEKLKRKEILKQQQREGNAAAGAKKHPRHKHPKNIQTRKGHTVMTREDIQQGKHLHSATSHPNKTNPVLTERAQYCLVKYYKQDYMALKDLKEHSCKTPQCHTGVENILKRRKALLDKVLLEEE